jgi:NAD(P)-dependent dehydrogenase (short-subunit alcohol dehydrogenase family)
MSTHTPVGVAAALAGSTPRRSIFADLALVSRVAIVTGAHRGIGLEQSVVLAEAGAIVYCLDLAPNPDEEWLKVQKHVASFPGLELGTSLAPDFKVTPARLEYVSVDVTDQKAMWDTVEKIAQKEGRLDVCIACAGILAGAECLDYPAEDFKKVPNLIHCCHVP